MDINVSEIITGLSQVFDLGNKALEFTDKILDIKTNNKDKEEDNAKIGSSGDDAQIGSSGYNAKIGSSGDDAQIGSSGDDAQIGSSGNYAQIGSSGDDAQIGSSGYNAKIGSSGYNAKIGSSGNYAQIGSSGDDAQIGSSGDDAVISAIGFWSRVKAKKGSWITLAEYKREDGHWKVDFVKTEKVDGIRIKEDVEYVLYNKEFREVIEADGIISVVMKHKGNVYKVINKGDTDESYLLCVDGIYSHGATLKEAKESLLYKIGDRDVSQYENLTKDSKVSKAEAIKMYRVITGACEAGTRYFVENSNINKKEYKISEIIKLTDGQYGSERFKQFFANK